MRLLLIILFPFTLNAQTVNINGDGPTLNLNNGSPSTVTINFVNRTYFTYDDETFPFTHQIWRDGSTEGQGYNHNYDYIAFKNSITGTSVYVDPVDGNNSNDGSSWALAKKTAINAFTTTSANIMYLKPGWYDYVNGLQGTLINRDLSIICPDGVATLTTSALPADLVMTEDATYANVYSGVYSPSGVGSNAVDLSNLNAGGIPVKLTPVADPETVSITLNSIYTNTTTRRVYVRLFDDRAPDADFIYFRNFLNLRGQSIYKLYGENINFYGSSGNVADLNNSTATTKQSVFVTCQFNYGLDNGVYTSNYAKSVFISCKAYYNLGDGFDYIQSTASGFEFNCTGSYNGYDNNGNNGSTAHDGAKVISVACIYEYNRGKNVHDIDATTARYAVGVTAGNSTSTVGADSYGFAVGIGTGLTTMWCIECTASGPQDGWKVFTGSQLYWKSGNYESKTNLIQGTSTELP